MDRKEEGVKTGADRKHSCMTGKRLLFVCNDYIGKNMAGPGIRYLEMAHSLTEIGYEVAILSRYIQKDFSDNNLIFLGKTSFINLLKWINWSDVIIQVGRPVAMFLSAILRKKTLFDQYDPVVFEILEDKGIAPQKKVILKLLWLIRQRLILRFGKGFIVANERQKDLLIGQLSILGYIKKLHDINIIPFGLPDAEPVKTCTVLRGHKIKDSDFLLIWGGGIWGWFDPFTLLRAMSRIKKQRDDIKIYFPGITPPNPDSRKIAIIERFINEAKELGLLDTCVFVNRDWTPYEERVNYLLEADAGISLHNDNLETRFAFRTRILDYIWAGLPIITSKGDSWADIIENKGLGITVPCGDDASLTDAIIKMADDATFRMHCSKHIKVVANEYRWSKIVERLQSV